MKRPVRMMLRSNPWSICLWGRSACRLDNDPNNYDPDIGFRVVIGRRNEKTS